MSASPSHARVTARLSQLQDSYGGFDVRQTTVSVDPAEYERAIGSGEVVARADVRVRDGDRLLCVRDGDEWVDPGGPVGAGQSIAETARDAVERRTGVRPTVEGVERVDIVSVNVADDDSAPIYRLRVRFAGGVEGADARVRGDGGLPDGVAWREEPPADDAGPL